VLVEINKVAPTDSTALITGETGTGKEMIARAIHKRSARSGRAFVTVNCAAVPASLIASELFGHERGAFTGALQRRQGKFELADGGTIFLDEIGELPEDSQLALLRVLQEREFERVGGVTPISVDVRIIAATNRNLERSVKEGSFRGDLYYRLNVVAINLPPLRERREDIAPLSQYFLRKHSVAIRTNITGISEEAQARLEAHDWPGNVRELANVIERAVVLGWGSTIALEDLPSRIAVGKPVGGAETLSYREGLDVARKQLILKALASTKGNRSAAAKVLGLEAKYFLKLMKSLGIE